MKLTKAIPDLDTMYQHLTEHQQQLAKKRQEMKDVADEIKALEKREENYINKTLLLEPAIRWLEDLIQLWPNAYKVFPSWPLNIRNLTLQRGIHDNWVVVDNTGHEQSDLINALLYQLDFSAYRHFKSLTANLLVTPREISVELVEGYAPRTVLMSVNLKEEN